MLLRQLGFLANLLTHTLPSSSFPWTPSTVNRRQRGYQSAREILCPVISLIYNTYMGCVDYFNRECFYAYRGQLRCSRVWKAIWFTLYHMAVYISFALYQVATYTTLLPNGQRAYKPLGTSPNKRFRLLLADELACEQRAYYNYAKRFPRKKPPVTLSELGLSLQEVLNHTSVHIEHVPRYTNKDRRGECRWCRLALSEKGRKGQKHVKTSTRGCAECQVALHEGACFILYHLTYFKKNPTAHEDFDWAEERSESEDES